MALEQFVNGAQTTLSAAITTGVQTSISVTSATGFPTGAGQFRILIDSEIMLVTAGQGTTTWTVTRAVEAFAGVQSAATHSSGATVTCVLTASALGTLGAGTLVYSPCTTSGSTSNIGTSLVDLSGFGLTATFTIGAGRRIRVQGFLPVTSNVSANMAITLQINEGATVLQQLAMPALTGFAGPGFLIAVVLTPTAGSHTYNLEMRTSNGTATAPVVSATTPGFLLVEDIGI